MLTRPFKSQSINNLYICSLTLYRSISFSLLECIVCGNECENLSIFAKIIWNICKRYIRCLSQILYISCLEVLSSFLIPPAPDQIRIINALYILVSNIYQLLMISSSNELGYQIGWSNL